MLGFARRAGKTVLGTELVCREMPKKRVKLVVISSTASEQTKKKLITKSEFYKIPYVEVALDTAHLASLLGKGAACAAVAILDERFADEIIKAAVSK
jgi:ribosomal protein L7Ae-like RNA K-turn-binding protein